MVSESTPPRRPVLTLDDLARPLTRRPERLHALTAAELAIAFSQGLDLAEGKPVGHAQRVCYIATALADALELESDASAAASSSAGCCTTSESRRPGPNSAVSPASTRASSSGPRR